MKKLGIIVLVVLGVLGLIAAYFYFTKTAGDLPHFLVGYTKGSSHKHTTHGLAALVLAVVFFAGAWMLSGYEAGDSPASKDLTQE